MVHIFSFCFQFFVASAKKYFTLARADGGADSAFSMEPEEMAQLVRECETAA